MEHLALLLYVLGFSAFLNISYFEIEINGKEPPYWVVVLMAFFWPVVVFVVDACAFFAAIYNFFKKRD